MTWTRALLYLAIWGVLTVYYFAFDHPPTAPSTPAETVTKSERLVPLHAAAVTQLSLEAHGLALRCDRTDGQWRVVEPAGAPIPADLIAALVTTLTELPPVGVVPLGGEGKADDFGLTDPVARITIGDGTARIGLQLGARNPSQTAVYARRDDAEAIVLVGLNVQYYVDLIIEALKRHAP